MRTRRFGKLLHLKTYNEASDARPLQNCKTEARMLTILIYTCIITKTEAKASAFISVQLPPDNTIKCVKLPSITRPYIKNQLCYRLNGKLCIHSVNMTQIHSRCIPACLIELLRRPVSYTHLDVYKRQ